MNHNMRNLMRNNLKKQIVQLKEANENNPEVKRTILQMNN